MSEQRLTAELKRRGPVEARIRDAARKAAAYERRAKKIVSLKGKAAVAEYKIPGTSLTSRTRLFTSSVLGGIKHGFPGGSENAVPNKIAWRAAVRLADNVGIDAADAFEVMRAVSRALFDELMLGRRVALPHLGVIAVCARGCDDPERELARIERKRQSLRRHWRGTEEQLDAHIEMKWGRGTGVPLLYSYGNMKEFFRLSVPTVRETPKQAIAGGARARYDALSALGLTGRRKPPEAYAKPVHQPRPNRAKTAERSAAVLAELRKAETIPANPPEEQS